MAKTKVEREKMDAVIAEVGGLSVTEQGGFTKLSAPGGRVYVAKSTMCSRVDLSGFAVTEPASWGVSDLGGEAKGAVKQQLSFDVEEAVVLQNFKKLLEHLKALPTAAPVKRMQPGAPRPRKPTLVPAESKGEKIEVVTATDADTSSMVQGDLTAGSMNKEQKAQRLALIRKVAREMKVDVSPKAIENFGPKDEDDLVAIDVIPAGEKFTDVSQS